MKANRALETAAFWLIVFEVKTRGASKTAQFAV
jgi:hypothetical protein